MSNKIIKPTFRAFYLPNLKSENEPSSFVQRKTDGVLWFVGKNNSKVRYPFYIPFVDKDWEVHQRTQCKDIDGQWIYEGDYLMYEDHHCGSSIFEVTREMSQCGEFDGFRLGHFDRQLGECEIVGNKFNFNFDYWVYRHPEFEFVGEENN